MRSSTGAIGTMTTEEAAETNRIAKALDSLPTLPVVALQIGEVVHSKNASVNQVAEILRSDPATSAKLLRLVNSPYFGIPGGVSDVARAIPFVGFNTLYQLVLRIGVLDTLGTQSAATEGRALWIHSLTVGTIARELAAEVKCNEAGACFTAGLLHDMGKIALAKVEPAKLAAAFRTMRDEGITLEAAEKRHGLVPHDKVGSMLARQWKFPAMLATPIEQHHAIHKSELRDRIVPHLRTITEVVASADQLARECAPAFGDGSAEDGDPIDGDALLERNGLSAAQRTQVCDRSKRALERSKIFLSLLDG
jgi:putative nucleotidyltransferase with HDIG domain